MTHAASPFDDVFVSSQPSGAPRPEEAVRVPRWWTSWEAWITLALIILVEMPVIGSLQSSDWVEEMPSLVVAALAGALAGWTLAQSRLLSVLATTLGAAVGVIVTIVLVLQRVPLSDPGLGTGWDARWLEFLLRMEAWGAALWDGGISTDALPFVVLLVGIVYLVVFLACWSVVRWQNAWMALIPGAIILLTNISYLPGQPSLAFVVFLVALPLCLGIALASGAKLFAGIIAVIVGGLVVSLASGSSVSVSGPTAVQIGRAHV